LSPRGRGRTWSATGPRFTAAITEFASRYADQNQRDHAQLVSAIATGAVESLPG
jgi:hypothetical protein